LGERNKCKKICSVRVKVDGVVGLKGTEEERERNWMKGRGNKMNILRERGYE